MNKLKLDLDTLSVQSFEPGATAAARGTVRAGEAPPSAWDPTPCSICMTVCKPTVVGPNLTDVVY
ncbi:MAG TPA: hypothetical protein VF092_19115 [Longimicrobium sp.]